VFGAALLALSGLTAPADAGGVASSPRLVVVDERVPEAAAFLARADAATRVVLVRRDEDGLRRIVEAVGGPGGYSSIHLLAHGQPGALIIGSTRLDNAAIGREQASIAALGAGIAPGGDLLIYGCEVARGDAGRSLVSALATATGADVAASTDPTGSASLGGDWFLEAASGPIESPMLAMPGEAPAFLLATTDLAGSAAWTPLQKGSRFDAFGDTQANKAGTEIVGDAGHAALYVNYDDNGTTGGPTPELDDILSLRLRIGDETKASHSSYAFFGFDADADDQLDGFISSGAGVTAIWAAGPDANISPSTTDIANSPYASYPQGAGNYRFAAVSATTDPDWDGNADLNGDTRTDVFVSIAVPVAGLDAFLGSIGVTYTPATRLRFVSLTATQTNALNSDFNGVSNSATSDWTQTFASLGMFSDPVDATGVVDTTPPVPPTVTGLLTNDPTPVLEGTAEASSTLTVSVAGATYTLTATAGGTWSLDTGGLVPDSGNFSPDVNGPNDVAVTSTDAAGNSSSDTTSDELVIDSTPPAAPTVASQTTSDSTPTLSGTAEAGSAVAVVLNGKTYGAAVSPGGSWSITVPGADALAEGTYDVAVTSTDTAGNASVDVTSDELVVDTTAPSTPTVTSQLTNDPTPVVTGTADAGTTLLISVGGATYDLTATGSGTWSLDTSTTTPASGTFVPDLNGASNVVVTSTDAAGNAASDVTTNELVIDTTPPVVTISPPGIARKADAASYPVSGSCTATDGIVTARITGGAPADRSSACTAGAWSVAFDVTAVPDGSDTVSISASQTDAAGNAGNAAATADKDTVEPVLVIVDNGSGGDDVYGPAEADAVSVTGTTDAEDGQLVTVAFSDGSHAPVFTSGTTSGGSWSTAPADLRGLSAGTIAITADVEDAAGNPAARASDTATLNTSAGLLTAADVGATNHSFPTFAGTTDRSPGTLVTVRSGTGAILCTAPATAGTPVNAWNCTSTTALREGSYTFTAEAADGMGGMLVASFAVTIDFDADDDGLPDVLEGTGDSDGDGLADSLDPDSDNDGIPDAEEAAGLPPLTGSDADGDGLDDALDADATGGRDLNGDGVDDRFAPSDRDGDGTPDYLDGDSDNDGIPDAVEGSHDTDGDGLPDYVDTDADSDGIPDALEAANLPPLTGSDADADGIDDALDVDATGGSDLDGDGVDDALAPRDTDGDGLPDYADPDSNGDGVPDAFGAPNSPPLTGNDSDGDGLDDALDADNTGGADVNADGVDDALGPADSDGDGTPDYLEFDSDGDGIADIAETGASGQDTDLDGIDDAFDVDQVGGVDADGDGIADGTAPDFDGDGIPNHQDLDSDNDGVLDVTEAGLPDANGDGRADGGVPTNRPPDSDGSGSPDYLDLDSDNDGINDIVGTPAEPYDVDGDGQIDREYGTDTDGDGIADVIDPDAGGPGGSVDTDADAIPDLQDRDDDNDGLPDVVESPGGADVDTDRDGIVDRLDLDSDGDGIPDSIEGAGSSTGDADGDGLLDDPTDSNGDGLADIVPANMQPVDTDLDGTPDFRDLDSDNDRLPDAVENGDFDQDGIADYRQKDSGLETAVTGSGASMDILVLIVLLGLVLVRRRPGRVLTLLPALLVLGLMLPQAPAHAAKPCQPDAGASRTACWYLGLGAGITNVDPEGESNGWRTTDSRSQGFKVLAGYQFHPRWFAELAYTDAGEAQLDNLNPAVTGAPAITYEVGSLFAGYWLRGREEALNAYVKAGLSVIRNDTTDLRVGYDKQTAAQIALGLGAQWQMTRHWFTRVELDSYDRDARYLGVSIGTYLGR